MPTQVGLQYLPELGSSELRPGGALAAPVRLPACVRRNASLLSPDYQQVILLRIAEGRSTAEVAELMHRSQGAVRILQHRAIAAIRHQLQKGIRRMSRKSDCSTRPVRST